MVSQRFIVKTRINVPIADTLFWPKGYPAPTTAQH
jgi:hypothetical protein